MSVALRNPEKRNWQRSWVRREGERNTFPMLLVGGRKNYRRDS